MRPICRLFYHNFVHAYCIRPLLCADLILNEFKQIEFSALDGCWFWTQPIVVTIASPQRRMPPRTQNLIYCTWRRRPLADGTPAYFIFLETRIIGLYILPLIVYLSYLSQISTSHNRSQLLVFIIHRQLNGSNTVKRRRELWEFARVLLLLIVDSHDVQSGAVNTQCNLGQSRALRPHTQQHS